MKKSLLKPNLFFLALFATIFTYSFVEAQKQAIAQPSVLQRLGPRTQTESAANPNAPKILNNSRRPSYGKTQVVNPIGMGRASNAFSTIRPEQNQVYADDSLGIVAFIHRQDVTIWGGAASQNGILRYDLSFDGGQNFFVDQGPLNPVYTQQSRYPQISGMANNSLNPFGAQLTWVGLGVTAQSTWDGIVAGTLPVVASNPNSSEDYYLQGDGTLLSGGLCERVTGEYWMADFKSDGLNAFDTLLLLKGVYNPNVSNVEWAIDTEVPISRSAYATTMGATNIGPNIAFDPLGQKGWAAFLGDISGGNDSVFSPVLVATHDAGQTWGAPIEVDMRSIPWLADSLKALWVDSVGNPVSSGRATTTFEFDLSVDVYGNPHFFVIVGSASTANSPVPNYSVYSGLAKYAIDFYSTTEGQTWEAKLVSPVLAFRGEFGAPDPNGDFIIQDNFPQIGRTQSGTHLFYSWADTDTALSGFGNSTNLAPDLMVAACRVTDNYQTCVKNVTAGDLVWMGQMLFPTQSPLALAINNGGSYCYKMPIVSTEMIANDQLQPCKFWYWGNDATFSESEFLAPGSITPGTACGPGSGCTASLLGLGVTGKVWNDDNNNGIQDGNESGVAGAVIRTAGAPWTAVSDANGDYQMFCALGTYTVEVIPPLYYNQVYPSNPATYAVTISSNQPVYNNADFGMNSVPVVDLGVYVSGGPARPGFTHSQQLLGGNIGTISSAPATIKLVHDANLTFNSASVTPSNYNAATRTLEWNVGVLNSGQSVPISINYTVAQSAPLNSVVINDAVIEPFANDADTVNNRDQFSRLVTGSYDPNDKTVVPAGQGPTGLIDPDQRLTYRIRFQNTGNDTAFTVRVVDEIDSDLDISTFEMLGASHPWSIRVYDNQRIEWRFDNILLVDSTTNEPESHGWIFFKISPKSNLPDGTGLLNRADIYFDFNPPILTNVTTNTIDYGIGKPDPKPKMEVSLSPNPFTEETLLKIEEYDGKPYDLQIYDIKGRLQMQQKELNQSQVIIPANGLAKGIYFYVISRASEPAARGKLILQ